MGAAGILLVPESQALSAETFQLEILNTGTAGL